MRLNYKSTVAACGIGYIIQAIVNTFVPLLFLTLQNEYSIPLSKITLLITVNFLIQLSVDILSTLFVDRIGYRPSVVIAHLFASCGLILLNILPDIMPDPFVGILISVIFYAIGGGLLEVVISPITEACPTKNKARAMSFLHSFYCWGAVLVVLCSTIFFELFGIENRRILTYIWAAVPIINMIFFILVPMYTLTEKGEKGISVKALFKSKFFLLLLVMMLCAGASELGISQWASTFAEEGLGVSKTVGDLAGPMAFSILMGLARVIYGKYGNKIKMYSFMQFSLILCFAAYLAVALVPSAVVGLVGCAVCGFSVGILWPATYSMGAGRIKGAGTSLFAFLALAGDFGCAAGPTLAGFVSSAFDNNLRAGILVASVFPLIMLICLMIFRKTKNK